MEFISNEFPEIKLYYRFKKLTKNQQEFTNSLLHNLINNTKSIYEFPPTLDKDFLYNSVLYSLSKQRNQKFVIICKSYDKINDLMKNFNQIAIISGKYSKNIFKNDSASVNSIEKPKVLKVLEGLEGPKVVPYFDRKMMCMNEKALEEASSLDFDSYCTRVTASFVDENSKCQFYTTYQNTFKFNSTSTSSTSLKIQYDDCSMNVDEADSAKYNFYENYSIDFNQSLSTLTDKKMCPYYYYQGLIKYTNPDIVICTYKDYFDMKSRIQISHILQNKEVEYKVIFDECSDIDSTLSNLYSMNIDDNLLFNAANQLYVLKEKYNSKITNQMSDSSYKDSYKIINPDFDHATEKEMVFMNGFPSPKNGKYPGTMRKPNNFLNLITRLLVFFKKAYFNLKNDNLWNIYKLQQQLKVDMWLDLDTLKYTFKRLIVFLNEIQFLDYQNIYHLLNFIFFISYLSIYNEGFLLNYQKYNNSDNYYLELYLIETHRIFQNSLKTLNPILLSGGIGKIDIFEKLLNFNEAIPVIKKTFTDDNITQNVYLTSISNTNVNNNSFYGEILMKLSKSVPDGVICYFSSIALMEYYIQKWNEQGVFDYIMNDKLLFIEEQDSLRLTNVITNYKKACDMGRGGILFTSTRNKMSLFDHTFTNAQSRAIIFIGFPIETKLTKIFELRLEHFKKSFDIESKEFFNYDAFRLFSSKIAEKIKDITDKKILVLLDERLISDKLKDYLPSWLHKLFHMDFDKDNVNTDERLKNIREFLTN